MTDAQGDGTVPAGASAATGASAGPDSESTPDTPPDPSAPEGAPDDAPGDEAAREALMRALDVAREAGLRPGMRPRRRRRRPEDPSASSSGPDRRDPQLLGAGVENLVAQRGWGEDVSAAQVMGRWPGIAGPDIAAHATPVSFEDGVLVVRAESTAWATQLTYMVPHLQARIDEAVGTGVVVSIRVNGPSAPSWKKGPRRVTGRGPRDTYG